MPRNDMKARIRSMAIEDVAARYAQLTLEAQRNNEPVPGEAFPLREELVVRVGGTRAKALLDEAVEAYKLLMPQEQ